MHLARVGQPECPNNYGFSGVIENFSPPNVVESDSEESKEDVEIASPLKFLAGLYSYNTCQRIVALTRVPTNLPLGAIFKFIPASVGI